MTGFAGWRDCWNQLDWGRIRFVGNDLVFVPVVSFTGRALLLLDFSPSVLVRPGVLSVFLAEVLCHFLFGGFGVSERGA